MTLTKEDRQLLDDVLEDLASAEETALDPMLTRTQVRGLVDLVGRLQEHKNDADSVRNSLNTMVRELEDATPADGNIDCEALERVLGTAAWNENMTVVKAETVRRWLEKINGLRRTVRSQTEELRHARDAQSEAEERVAELEAKLAEKKHLLTGLTGALDAARSERDKLEAKAAQAANPSPTAPQPPTYDTADYYDCRDSERLEHESPEAAIEEYLDNMANPYGKTPAERVADLLADIKRIAPLKMTAYARSTVDLSEYGLDLAERLAEILDDDEMLSDPEGDHSVLEDVDMKALGSAIGAAIAPFSAKAKPWPCDPVGTREYSAEEIESMMRKSNPGWFEVE